VVLFMPNVLHAHECVKYKSSEIKYFHEASFDAYCVGYGKSAICMSVCTVYSNLLVFLRIAHLVAMNGVRCVTATAILVVCTVPVLGQVKQSLYHFLTT